VSVINAQRLRCQVAVSVSAIRDRLNRVGRDDEFLDVFTMALRIPFSNHGSATPAITTIRR